MSASNVKWVRLGDYIERSMANNSDLKYGPELIEGVNSDGVFCESRANTIDINLKPYKIVNNGDFVYNPSRLNIGSLAYRTTGMCIVSHLYVVFHLNELGKKHFLPDFLYMYFKRDEFLRLVTFLNLGSQRPEFNFYDMSEIRVPMPSIDIQHEVVATYNGLKSLAEQNEALLEPLSKACEALVVDCKGKYPEIQLGDYIEESFEQNINDTYSTDNVRGVSINKELIDTKANMDNVPLSKYKVVRDRMFVFNVNTARMGDKFAIALCKGLECLVSSIYGVFKCKDTSVLLPEYLFIQLKRSEFDRYVRFNSWGSARETFTMQEMKEVKIPLPPISVQKSIVNIFRCLEEAKCIALEAREMLKTLYPALVQRAANS